MVLSRRVFDNSNIQHTDENTSFHVYLTFYGFLEKPA